MPARGYLHGTGPGEQQRLEVQATLLGGEAFLPSLTPRMRVLDVGCGTGAIARRVAPHVAPAVVVGLDREATQLSAARGYELAVGRLAFVRGNAEELPFRSAVFDGAYSRFLLEHVPDPPRVIRSMARVVRKDGWICALEWEPDSLVMYPPSPKVQDLWQRIYAFQTSTGVDPRVGRRLHEIFREVPLRQVCADTLAWSVTGAEPDALRAYVEGAREIVRQVQMRLIADGYATSELVAAALAEYERVVASPSTFISHGFCRARGSV